MPGYYLAVTEWRAGLDSAIAADSGVMRDRAMDDTAVAYAEVRAALDAELDRAGR